VVGSASERFTPLEALYECLDTIQYNTTSGNEKTSTMHAKEDVSL